MIGTMGNSNSIYYECPAGVFSCTPTNLESCLYCIADDCSDDVPSGPGLSTNCDGLRVDQQCTQVCTAGYEDNNSGAGQVYSCSGGTFLGMGLTCTPQSCTSNLPRGVGYGTQCDNLVTDGSCTQRCTAGYSDDNSGAGRAYTCPAGEFTGQGIFCTPNSCTANVPTGAGYGLQCNQLVTDGSCTQTCNTGYSGSSQSYACPAGVFEGTPLVCTPNECAPTQLENTNLSAVGSITGTTGQSVSVTCNAGYSADGSQSTLTCEATGYFSANFGGCIANACASTQVANSDKATANSIFGNTGQSIAVTCNAGYGNSGVVTCQASGIFTSLTCSPTPCEATQVANSDFFESGSIQGISGESVFVTCINGYSGSGSATCSSSGVFNTITCSPNPCNPTQVINSNRASTGSISGNFGESVSFTCNSGYSGSGSTTCGVNGEFSTVTCIPNSCQDAFIANAFNGNLVGTTGMQIFVDCLDGYVGGGTATCSTTGTWRTNSGSDVETGLACNELSCGPLTIENSNVTDITGVTDDVVVGTCNATGVTFNITCVGIDSVSSGWNWTVNCDDDLSGVSAAGPSLFVLAALFVHNHLFG